MNWMKMVTIVLLASITGCTMTPEDHAWRVTLETPTPERAPGNCVPVARKLQAMYGGYIVILKKDGNPIKHAVLYQDDGTVMDNGTLGYITDWDSVMAKGWELVGLAR